MKIAAILGILLFALWLGHIVLDRFGLHPLKQTAEEREAAHDKQLINELEQSMSPADQHPKLNQLEHANEEFDELLSVLNEERG